MVRKTPCYTQPGIIRRITAKDKSEFAAYLRACTLAQVRGAYDKERSAGRRAYATLAKGELLNRGVQP